MSDLDSVDLNEELQAYITNPDKKTVLYELDFDKGYWRNKQHPAVNLIEMDANSFDIATLLKEINEKFEEERRDLLRYYEQSKAQKKRIAQLETMLEATILLLNAGLKDDS